MSVVAIVLVAIVALIHLYIVVLEMALWTTPRGRAAFGTDAEFAEASKTLAANQGLYNGFLVAGLVWGLVGRQDGRPGVLPALRHRRRGCTAPRRSAAGSCSCRRYRPPSPSSPSSPPTDVSSQPRNASRFAVDSPRRFRHSHSLRMDEANPSSRIVLNDSSA